MYLCVKVASISNVIQYSDFDATILPFEEAKHTIQNEQIPTALPSAEC